MYDNLLKIQQSFRINLYYHFLIKGFCYLSYVDVRRMSESKERFAIQIYLLIVGKKQNMQ